MAIVQSPVKTAYNAATGLTSALDTSTNPDCDPEDHLAFGLQLEDSTAPGSYALEVPARVHRQLEVQSGMTHRLEQMARQRCARPSDPVHPPVPQSNPQCLSCHTSRRVQIEIVVFFIALIVAFIRAPARTQRHPRASGALSRVRGGRQFAHCTRARHAIDLPSADRTQPQPAAAFAILQFEPRLIRRIFFLLLLHVPPSPSVHMP